MQQIHTKDWVEQLATAGPGQDASLSELRNLLGQRLIRAFGSKPGVDQNFVEDVVQDALMKILAALKQFQGRSKFTTWATTIAIRLAITEMRRLRWKEISLEQFLENQPAKSATLSTSLSAEMETDKAQFVGAMYQVIEKQLTEKQRTALLAELKGMPQEEIGRRLGSNRNAIYKLTHDARKRLKQGLIAAGYSGSDLVSFQGESQ